MKNSILLLLMVFSILLTSGQTRENIEIPEFVTKSEKLSNAIGWEQNKTTGKWISNKNTIDNREIKYESTNSQSFRWIQIGSLLYEGKKYYTLLYENKFGTYKYPNIQEGYSTHIRTEFFIIDETEYKKFMNQIDSKVHSNIIIKSGILGSISDRHKILGGEHLYNEENLLANINKAIKNPSSYSYKYLILNIQEIDGQEIIRFRLPYSNYRSNSDLKYLEEDILNKYFEVDYLEFKKLLIE